MNDSKIGPLPIHYVTRYGELAPPVFGGDQAGRPYEPSVVDAGRVPASVEIGVRESASPPRSRPGRLTRLIAVGMAGLAFATAGCTVGEDEPRKAPSVTAEAQIGMLPEFDKGAEQDLISNGRWDSMPGTSVQDGRLKIHRTGLAILAKETDGRPLKNPPYVANPPINLFGVHMQGQRDGDVGYAARLQQIKGAATVSFMSRPTTRYDERLERHEGVDVTVDGDKAVIRLFDGTSNNPSVTQEIALGQTAGSAAIAVAQSGGEVIVAVNGKQLRVPAAVLGRQTWFGFDASDSWELSSFTAYPLKGNQVSCIDGFGQFEGMGLSPDGLAGQAAANGHRKLWGVAVDPTILMSNPEYAKFILQNFNAFTTEMNAKFQAIQPEENKFEFAELDALVQFANNHGIEVYGHTLAFTEAYPKWLSEKLNDPAMTEDQALELLRNHIKTMVSRYDGKHGHGLIKRWDVVNEPLDPDNYEELNRQHIWHKKLGPKYIEEALRAVREANPEAETWINEWGAETDDDRMEADFKLGKSLRDMGLLDGLAFQGHFFSDDLDDDDVMDDIYSGRLERMAARAKKLGLKIRFSEVSVELNHDDEAQADVNGMIVEAAIRHPNFVGVGWWGATNSEFDYHYFTGSGRARDPGNDAPTVQTPDGKIIPRRAWRTILDTVRS